MKRIIFFIVLFILFCSPFWRCHQGEKTNNTLSIAKTETSFEEFENLADNFPDRYISNPDSFLNRYNLTPKTEEEKEIYGYSLVYMAYNLRAYGRILQSIQYYEKALEFIKNNSIKDFDIALYILKPLSNNYIRIDDNQKAITILEELLGNNKNIPNNEGLINNLANAYIYNNEAQKAIELLTSHLDNLNTSLHKALYFNTLAQAYEFQQDSINSTKNNKYALIEFEKFPLQGDTLIWYCGALTQYAEIHKSPKEVVKAIEILEVNFPKTQFRNKANAYLSLAAINFEQNNFGLAKKNYTQAFNNFKKDNSKYILDYKYTYSLLGLARCLKAQQQIDSALFYYEWAIENDFRTQQLITSEKDQLRNNIWNKGILDELITLYIDNSKIHTYENRATLLWCIELSKARLLINEINRSDNWSTASSGLKNEVQQIRQLYQKLDASESESDKNALSDQIKKLKAEFQLSEGYFETINFNPSKSKFLEKIQNKNYTYYSYYIHQDKTWSILYSHKNEISYTRLNDKSIIDSLQRFKSTYFSNSPQNFNNNPEIYKRKANYFYQLLLPHISKEQKDVFLSLDGILYGLPFDALYKDDFLIKNHNFAYLNSFLLFDFITKTSNSPSSEISLLYRSEFPKPLPHLEFVSQEVKTLTSKFKTLAFEPNQQNDSTIREAFSRTNIIHIAAHTILDSIQAPYLYLHQAISTNQLRFFDIKTPLVFLSACNTGSGRPLPSEGTESIQRVFMSKNVPSVISTYWFANDEVMLDLTSNFYDELTLTQNPMLALANAKRNFLSKAAAQQQNPWYWSNINYTGIGNKVGLKKTSSLPIIITGITLIGLVLFLLFKWFSRTNKVSIKKRKISF